MSKAQISEQIRQSSMANMQFFGYNYWKSILEIALADDAQFIDIIYDN